MGDPKVDDCPMPESFYDPSRSWITKGYEWEVVGGDNFRLINKEKNLCLGACNDLICRGLGRLVKVEKCYYKSDCSLLCGSDSYQIWSFDKALKNLKNQERGQCLAWSSDVNQLSMADCTSSAEQQWALIDPRPPTTTTTTTPPHPCEASYNEVIGNSFVCLAPAFRAYEQCKRCTERKCEKWSSLFSATEPYRYECPAGNQAFQIGADKDKFRLDVHVWGFSCDLASRIRSCSLPKLDQLVCDDPSFKQEKIETLRRSYSCSSEGGIIEQVTSLVRAVTSGCAANAAPLAAMIAWFLWML